MTEDTSCTLIPFASESDEMRTCEDPDLNFLIAKLLFFLVKLRMHRCCKMPLQPFIREENYFPANIAIDAGLRNGHSFVEVAKRVEL